MSDLISRQDAIDAIEFGITYAKAISKETGEAKELFQEGNNELRKAVERVNALPPAEPEQRWIPCEERLPEEDNWLGGSGRQFSDSVLVSIVNSDDENERVEISYTIDGEWALNLPKHCKILAWMPMPEPYKEKKK